MIFSSLPVLLFIGEMLLKVLMISIVLLQRKKTPSAKLAWIMLIIVIPFVGTLLYLFVGTTRLGSLRRRRHREILKLIPQSIFAHISDRTASSERVQQRYHSISYIAETVGASQVIGGNQATLFGDSEKMIDSLANDIDNAKDHCHILSYIMLDDAAGSRISQALMQAADRGIVCRLLLDDMGSRVFLKSQLCQELKARGVRVVAALPASLIRAAFVRLDLRNHRKIAVIDNSIGYVGSQNIADSSFAPKPKYAPWIDASVRMTGPAVRELQAIFVQDWFMDSDENLGALLCEPLPATESGFSVQLMATGPNSNNQALGQMLQTAFFSASEELIITTPYFSPDTATESALLITAKRGVQTHLVIPARNDSRLVAVATRSRFRRLLEAGVHIHEFHGGMLHSKTMTIDRELALIGSANLDRRSLELNFEISLLIYDTDFASELRFLQTSYLEQSVQVDPNTPSQWSVQQRLWQNAVGLIAPIL